MAVKAAHPRAMRPHASRFIFSEPHSLIVASQTRRAEATNVTLRRHGVTATICCSRTLNDADTLAFAPRLPGGLTRLSFTVVRRNIRLRVGVTALMASYQLLIEHGGLDILHYGERIKLDGRNLVERAIPPPIMREPVHQPLGRRPLRQANRKERGTGNRAS